MHVSHMQDVLDVMLHISKGVASASPRCSHQGLLERCLRAQVGTNYYQTYEFVRDFTPRPMSALEVRYGDVGFKHVQLFCSGSGAIGWHGGGCAMYLPW